ncbi:MAG: M20/M25/M40 family metallo-hydrolase [Bacillota bacterium]
MDWNLVLKQHLQALIRINTTNPPGGETEAARYIAGVCAEAGIEHELVEPIPGRGSVVARLRGDGSLRPLLLLGHLDVVPADARDWTHPPFAAEEHDGFVWGRGAVDMKKLVATWLTIMLRFKAEGVPLKRDLILAATADEETGGRVGIGWLAEKRPDLVDAEFALNEGGGNALTLGGQTYLTLQAGEKNTTSVQLLARGVAGHASMPSPRNSVVHLAEAIVKVGQTRLPVHETKTVRTFLERLIADLGPKLGIPAGTTIPFERVPGFIDQAVADPFAQMAMLAMISNTATPTMVNAGQKVNVIPSQAAAELDGRILPGQTSADLLRELQAIMPPNVQVSVGEALPATESDPDTPLAAIIDQVVAEALPGAKTIPFLLPATTDARHLRPRGMVVYGFDPMLPGERVAAHGVDERISVASLGFGLKVLHEVVMRTASTRH